MRCLVYCAVVAGLLAPAAVALAAERVVMYRDRIGADFAFIDRFLKDLAPKSYRPEKSWGLPEVILEQVYVGRYDVNDDGADELFVRVLYSCGSAGCDTYLFEKIDGEWMPLDGISRVTVLDSTRIDGEAVATLDVWIDPATGYKSVFADESGFRWTGERYAYPGFPMWHPSAKLSVARNRSKGKSDGFCHQDHARQHEIESEWDMVAFDIAGRAVSRTHRSCRLHA